MKRQRATDLRAAVDRLPLGTRQAMLKGIDKNPIIVGADGNVRGGVCPMLAASKGHQKKLGKPFARAWDAYAGVRFSRPASKHELRTLKTMLEVSIDNETESPVDLSAAIASYEAVQPSPPTERPAVSAALGTGEALDMTEAIAAHEAAVERRRADERRAAESVPVERTAPTPRERVDTGERDRTQELERRHGWAWLRPVRRFDDYERALQLLDDAERAGLSEVDQHDRRSASRGRELAGSAAGRN